MSHTGETPHKCSTCGKGFRRKDKLRIHEILHGPEETKYRFPCEVCGKRFTQNNNLKTHIKSHHSQPRSPESSQPTPPPPALPLLPLTSTFSSFPGPGIHWPAKRLQSTLKYFYFVDFGNKRYFQCEYFYFYGKIQYSIYLQYSALFI